MNTEKVSGKKLPEDAGQESTVDRVVKYIESRIRSRRLRAGDRIPPENELCGLLNVSRTSVREAMKYLKAMKVIQVNRGDGTYVSNPEDIMFYSPLLFKLILQDAKWSELFEFREAIEFSAVKSAIKHASPQDIAELAAINDKINEVYKNEPENFQELHKYDMLFHTTLAKATRNRMLEDIYKFTLEIFSPLTLGNYAAGQGAGPATESHTLIIEAIRQKDFFLAGYAAHKTVELWAVWIKKQDNNMFSMG